MKKIIYLFSISIITLNCGGNEASVSDEANEETVEVTADETTEEIIDEEIFEAEDNDLEEFDCGTELIEVYMNDPDDSGTNIRNKPGGKVLMTLHRDEETEFIMNVSEAKKGWFKIEGQIQSTTDMFPVVDSDEAWIHGSVLSVDTRNYGGELIEVLHSPTYGIQQPDHVIDKEMGGFHLLDKCGAWLKVKGHGIEGWIHSEWLCGNPLTTCS